MNHKHIKITKHEFWDYSVALYRQEGVADACLFLQKEFSLNINILLFCCWYADTCRGTIAKKDLSYILNGINAWHEKITSNINRIGIQLVGQTKESWATVYKESLRHKLMAENIEQLMILHAMPATFIKRRTLLHKSKEGIVNLQNYFVITKTILNEEGYHAARIILAKAFHQVRENDLPQLLIPFATTA